MNNVVNALNDKVISFIKKKTDGRKDIQFVKSAWSISSSELKAHVLPNLEENNKRRKTNTKRINFLERGKILITTSLLEDFKLTYHNYTHF